LLLYGASKAFADFQRIIANGPKGTNIDDIVPFGGEQANPDRVRTAALPTQGDDYRPVERRAVRHFGDPARSVRDSRNA
jgi:hypothetical protein